MVGGRHRLDEYVRQATRLGQEKMALLADVAARRALFEELARLRAQDDAARRSTRQNRRIATLAALAAVVAIVVVATLTLT